MVPLVTALIVTLLGALVLSTYPKVSPIDELQHIDSALKASQGRWYLPAGEQLGQEAMRIQACSGIDYPDFPTPPCNSTTLSPSDFQELGLNTAAGRPSVYYVVTGYVASAISGVTGANFFTSARIVNLLSLAAGAALLAWCGLFLSGSPILSSSLALLAAISPQVLSQSITVNPDSWSIAAGTAVVALSLVASRWSPLRLTLILAITTTLTVLVKPNFVVLATVPVVLLGIAWWQGRESEQQSRFIGALIAALVAAIVFVFTLAFTYFGDNPILKTPQYVLSAIPPGARWPIGPAFDGVLQNVLPTFFTPTVDIFESRGLVGAGVLSGMILASGALATLANGSSRTVTFGLATAAVTALLAAPGLVYLGQFLSHVYFGYPSRYSFVALPILALTWAATRPRRPWLFALAATAVVLEVLYAFFSR